MPTATDPDTLLEAARELLGEGISPVPVPYRSKVPVLEAWQKLRLTPETLADHFNGTLQNIGALNGAPSGGFVDVDLDSDEAVVAARYLLPPTGYIWGRGQRPASHYGYRVDVSPAKGSTPYDDPLRAASEPGHRLLELRSTGSQTIMPPSVHPSGDPYLYRERTAPAVLTAADLDQAVHRTAAAALLARYWPGQGARHTVALALAGWLLRRGLDADDAADLIHAAAVAAGDNEADDRCKAVATTAARLAAGDKATGYPNAEQQIEPRVLRTVAEWLGVGVNMQPASRPDERVWAPRGSIPTAPAVPTLPAEMLPGPLRPWICDLAEQARLPLEMFAVPALVALGTVVGRAVAIRPWCFSDYMVVPNLWGAIVASSGKLKSHAQSEGTRPLRRLAAAERRRYEAAAPQADARIESLKAQRDGLKGRIAQATKKGLSDVTDIEDDLARVMEDHRDAPLIQQRYSTQDGTVEKIGELLVENPHGLLIERDELAGWLGNFDRQGHENDRAFMLEAWNGTNDYTFDRIGRGTIHIPALCLSVIGGIQPARLQSYVRDAITNDGADGLLARVQLLVWPDHLPAWERVERWPNHDAAREVDTLFEQLDSMTPVQIGAARDEREGGLPYLRFDPQAQQLADAWRDELEPRLRSNALAATPAFEAAVSKQRSLFPSLALLFHLISIATGEPSGPVRVEAARLAAAWCDFLEAHARKVYADELTSGYAAARALAQRLGAVPDGTPVRDIYRNGWAELTTAERVEAALALLESAHWVRIDAVDTGGRPSRIVRLHPELRAGRYA